MKVVVNATPLIALWCAGSMDQALSRNQHGVLGPGLWELRISLTSGLARVLFTVEKGLMILLHGFIKKSQKIPPQDLALARRRLRTLQEEL